MEGDVSYTSYKNLIAIRADYDIGQIFRLVIPLKMTVISRLKFLPPVKPFTDQSI
jgi:hypothetical protein